MRLLVRDELAEQNSHVNVEMFIGCSLVIVIF